MANIAPTTLPASIPSPDEGVWHIGPFPLRAYALAIIAGIVVAIWLGSRRWQARGGSAGTVSDIAIWAVPFGIVGARIYHVITDNQLYFGEGRDPWRALQIWEGGIGIWGAIAGGALGVWIACRRRGIPMPAMADALAPGILLAQAIGRWGNWFNQELFGRPTDLPWGLEIDPGNRPAAYANAETFHPTFLYESLWAVAVALFLLWADRRFQLGHGRVLALYVAGYTLGRGFFEYLRVDPANEIFGLRVNMWVSGLLFIAAIVYFVLSARLRPGREAPETVAGTPAGAEAEEEAQEKVVAGTASETADTGAAGDASGETAGDLDSEPGSVAGDDGGAGGDGEDAGGSGDTGGEPERT
ncbi:prolipoprotein diacylglyceryl transferase [Actinobacteria bacterium YIM 96077]|uniref:Phosphatidylglycerol--prolipoprotein diacylglyceryl transferase n=2 Tax=Phytoactinopolyspora halophila TaxID=1981511 RepID=A0A329QWZ1_9ACTN|nr:prolipoprotein diacylglyceryl transferase [Actinobacteria bacterium YIM 96077]RAW16496.1 prolipoprotein diacylglyceryl transferase [Phytoactinopolyspora halophila]